MSTDLYGIRILKKEESQKRIRIRVFVVYYDVAYKSHQPLPEDHSFFFRILWDSPGSYGNREHVLSELVSTDHYLDEAWVDRHTWRFIDRVERLETRNFPVKNFKKYSDFYYERNGSWKDEQKLVQADYDVYVSDEAYLLHLEEGVSWGTTSYETTACLLDKSYAALLPDISKDAVKLVPFNGEQEEGTPHEVLFSSDGKYLFALSQANEVVCYNTGTWKETWRSKQDSLFGQLNQNNHALWLQSYDKVVSAWEYATGKPSEAYPAVVGRIMSSQGNYLGSFDHDDALLVSDKTGAEHLLMKQEEAVEAAAFSPDEKYVALGTQSGSVEIWDLEKKKRVSYIATDTDSSIISLSFDPSGTLLAVMPIGEAIRIYDWEKKQEVMRYALSRNFMNPSVWSPDNRFFAISHTNRSNGYGGYVEVYPVGWEADQEEATRLQKLRVKAEKQQEERKVYTDFLKQLDCDDPQAREDMAALLRDPYQPRLWTNLGTELPREEGMRCYELAIAIDPDYSYAYYNLGYNYDVMKAYDKAEYYYKMAIEKRPAGSSAWINLGNLYGRSKRYEQCMDAFDHAIRLVPKHHTPYASGSYYSILSGNPDKGFEYAVEGIRQENLTNSYLNKGHVHLIRGEKEEAIDCYRQSLQAFLTKSSEEDFWNDYDSDFELMPQYGISLEDYNSLKAFIGKNATGKEK